MIGENMANISRMQASLRDDRHHVSGGLLQLTGKPNVAIRCSHAQYRTTAFAHRLRQTDQLVIGRVADEHLYFNLKPYSKEQLTKLPQPLSAQ